MAPKGGGLRRTAAGAGRLGVGGKLIEQAGRIGWASIGGGNIGKAEIFAIAVARAGLTGIRGGCHASQPHQPGFDKLPARRFAICALIAELRRRTPLRIARIGRFIHTARQQKQSHNTR